MLFMDLSSESVIGLAFPNIVQCAAHKLHCHSTRMIRIYNAELTHLCNEHNMFHHMDLISQLSSHLTKDNFLLLMDTWDNEFKEFMLHAENHCSKYMKGHIEWSLAIGIWYKRCWLLHHVCLWMMGTGFPNLQNMICECYQMHISDPCTSTYGAICA
jgi:hypothetical protein